MSVYNKIVLGDETLIDLTDATLMGAGATATDDAAKILAGTTANPNSAYGADGVKIVGTCTYDADTSDATATAAEILSTKTAYVEGSKLTGTMNNHDGDTVELNNATSHALTTAEAGFYPQGSVFELSAAEKLKLIPTNIADGVTILGVEGTYAGDEVKVTPDAVDVYVDSVIPTPASGVGKDTYTPATYYPSSHTGDTPTAYSNFTVNRIYTEESSNAKGVGLIIGKVKS